MGGIWPCAKVTRGPGPSRGPVRSPAAVMQGAAPDRTGLVDLHWRAAGPGADIGGEEGGDRVTPILTRVAVTAESHPCLQVAAGNRLCRGLDCSLRLLTASAKSEHSVPCHRKGKCLRFIGALPGPPRRRRVPGVPVPQQGGSRPGALFPGLRAHGRVPLVALNGILGPSQGSAHQWGCSAGRVCGEGLSGLRVCFHLEPYSSAQRP